MARWTAVVLAVAAVLLLGQYAAFRGALPFPQFLAFVVVGTALLTSRRHPARQGTSGSPDGREHAPTSPR
jgi:hypothetical protein